MKSTFGKIKLRVHLNKLSFYLIISLLFFSCDDDPDDDNIIIFNGGIETLNSDTIGSTHSISGRVVTKDLFISADKKGPYFIQDDIAGFAAYINADENDFYDNVIIGMIVTFNGTKKMINNEVMLEVDSFSYGSIDATKLNNLVFNYDNLQGNESQYIRVIQEVNKIYVTEKDSIPEKWENRQYRAIFNNNGVDEELKLEIKEESGLAGEFVGAFNKELKGILRNINNELIIFPTVRTDFRVKSFGVVFGPEIVSQSSSSVRLKLITNLPADYKLEYWEDGTNMKETIEKKLAISEHIIDINNLNVSTNYKYNIEFVDHFMKNDTVKILSASFSTN